MTLTFIVFVIGLAFLFDFINGFHDAPNSIAALVATGVLKPWAAVIWAAFFNFIAFLFFHLKVANTVGAGLISPQIVEPYIIFSALTGAILFNLVTWYFGLPSSSSHALIGGLLGAALVTGGVGAVNIGGLSKVLIAIILSPLLGFSISWLIMSFFLKKIKNRRASRVQKISRLFQLIASALLSLGHGGNDAQKTMGVIAILLFAGGFVGGKFIVPFWVVISCNLVMGLGTLLGGWRIVHTLGTKITPLNPLSGGCSSSASALTLFVANCLGIPVSTTHIVTGSIAGVGSAKGNGGSNWGILKKVAWAWCLTIPCSAAIAALLICFRHVIPH